LAEINVLQKKLRKFLPCLLLLLPHFAGAQNSTQACRRLVLRGEVATSQRWTQPIGQGWSFSLLPIVPGRQGYSGWDLVVDRDRPTGFPDALLLATPPWGSISEREIGTTFGLRAQDAIGWNPRSFHFLIDPATFAEGQKQFRLLEPALDSGKPDAHSASSSQRLLELAQHSASGQLRILDARLNEGIADPAPFAQNWATQARHQPHTSLPAGSSGVTPHGSLQWIRFEVTLWLPADWRAPSGVQTTPSACAR
jgi:hypothetical protein